VIASLRRFAVRLSNFVRPTRGDEELARELAVHRAMLEEEYRRSGMPPDEAAACAARVVDTQRLQELHRDTRSFLWLEDARRDVRYAMRTLARTPGFTLVAVLTLALGIGSVTIIYSVIHNVLLDPLPYPNSDRFVNVLVQDARTGQRRQGLSAAEFLDYTEQSTVFEEVVGTLGEGVVLTAGDLVEYVRGVWVTPNFFEFMGLPPLFGRALTPDDGKPDAPPVAVLRHRAWVRHFGSDPSVVGRIVRLGGELRTIVGVMPPRFTWHAADFWIPRRIDRGTPPDTLVNLQARLRRGVSLREADAQLNVIASRRPRERAQDSPARIQVVNVIDHVVGGFSRVLYITLAAVGLLLLIACCNVANMLLARATTREKEMTVRAALGAGRGRIVRQLLVESLLLALAGATVGCLLAYAGLDALVGLLPTGPLPGEIDITLDGPALAVSLGTAVIAALLFGIAPALYTTRRDLVDALKGAGRTVTGGRGRLRNTLVTAEIALALVLLLSAGLLMRSFIALAQVDLGYDTKNLLAAPVVFAPGEYQTAAEKRRFFDEALRRVAAVPGVVAAAATSSGSMSDVEVPGAPQRTATKAVVQFCTTQYFETMGIPLLRGRRLPAVRADEIPRLAVVNRTLATTFFGGDALGRQIRLPPPPDTTAAAAPELLEIVGVVDDINNQGLRERPAPHIFIPGAAAGRGGGRILVRTVGDPLNAVNAIRAAIGGVDRRVALIQPMTVEESLDMYVYAQPRFTLVVLGVFAITGTLLVALGVFSVMAYTVSRQAPEIAVRMALGASERQVLTMVLRTGAKLMAGGVGAGLLASVATSRVVASQLWNTSPHDPLTIAVAVSLIVLVALAACYVPALRAARVAPIAALRAE